MPELTEFLLARLADLEARAQNANGCNDFGDGGAGPEYLVSFLPARVLADVEAKRAIVALHRLRVVTWEKADGMKPFTELLCIECGQEDNDQFVPTDWPCPTLRALAQPYADHPDYRQEWTP